MRAVTTYILNSARNISIPVMPVSVTGTYGGQTAWVKQNRYQLLVLVCIILELRRTLQIR